MIRRGLPARFGDASMENLHETFECVMQYQKDVAKHLKAGEGLFLSGPPGVGKTYAIAALTKAVAAGVQYELNGEKRSLRISDWVFATGPSLFEHYALPYDAGDKDRTNELESVNWLVINDLGKEYRGGAYEKQVPYKLGRLLRARVEAKLVTHITTNLKLRPEESEDHSGPTVWDVYGESTFSLLMEACPCRYEVNGPDRRKEHE